MSRSEDKPDPCEVKTKLGRKEGMRTMKLMASEKIKCSISDEMGKKLIDSLEEEFKKISQRCEIVEGRNGDAVKVEMVSATIGSINRVDVSMVTVDESRKKDGYTINAETEYKPSVIFFVLLAVTILFCFPTAAIPVGMFFYNKSIVQKSIADVLKRVKDENEE